MFRAYLAAAFAVLPMISAAQACGVNPDALAMAYAQWQGKYAVASDIDCATPANPAQVILCDDAAQNGILWHMAALDDAAYVYAFENATGRETLPENRPRDETFIAARDACTSTVCLCTTIIEHTNGSLGGMSPY